MALDLTLMPFTSYIKTRDFLQDVNHSHILLQCQTNAYDLYKVIRSLVKPDSNAVKFITDQKQMSGYVGKHFGSYLSKNEDGDVGYGSTPTDNYNEPLMWVRASELLKLKDHPQVKNNQLNRAAWAYLATIDKDTPVALYWN